MKKNIIVFLVIFIAFIFSILGYYICPFRYFFGLYCPGCGTTHMIISLFNLDIYQAFRYNPLMFIFLIILLIYLLLCIIFKKNILKFNYKFLIVLLIITILYGIMRNIEIFAFLRPTLI